jgi:hypothetical protein
MPEKMTMLLLAYKNQCNLSPTLSIGEGACRYKKAQEV